MMEVWSPAADVEKNGRSGEKREAFYTWASLLIVDGSESAAHEVGPSLSQRVINSLS